MAINSESELEAIVREIILQLDKQIFARVEDAKLESARRLLISVRDSLRRKEELTPRQVKGLNDTAASLREVINDERINNQLWDIADFLELKAKH